METGSGLGTIVVLFGFVVAVLWVILPFAVFGLKPILRDILAELKRANRQ